MSDQKSQWQPISTVPTGGKEVLVYIPEGGERSHTEVTYSIGWFGRPDKFVDRYGVSYSADPTHWMELPIPPEGES